MIRVLSLHQKEVRFETGFSLAMFSETTKVEFMERGSCSVGSLSTTVRKGGLVLGGKGGLECVKHNAYVLITNK